MRLACQKKGLNYLIRYSENYKSGLGLQKEKGIKMKVILNVVDEQGIMVKQFEDDFPEIEHPSVVIDAEIDPERHLLMIDNNYLWGNRNFMVVGSTTVNNEREECKYIDYQSHEDNFSVIFCTDDVFFVDDQYIEQYLECKTIANWLNGCLNALNHEDKLSA